MSSVTIITRADAIIAKLAEATGVREEKIAGIVNRERRRVSCLASGASRDDVAERVHRWFTLAGNERCEIARLGVADWMAPKSEAFVWATLHGLKRDGFRSVTL